MRHITWLGLLVGATAVGGTAYKSVGPDGTVIFSDRPMPNAEEVRLPEPSTYTPPDFPTKRPEETKVGGRESTNTHQVARIVAPADDSTAFAAEGGLDVDVLLDPPLMNEHTMSYIMDGRELATGIRANQIRITDIDRGTHHLQVEIRDQTGKVVTHSQSVKFHYRQPSILDPLRRGRPPPGQPQTPGESRPPTSTEPNPVPTPPRRVP